MWGSGWGAGKWGLIRDTWQHLLLKEKISKMNLISEKNETKKTDI